MYPRPLIIMNSICHPLLPPFPLCFAVAVIILAFHLHLNFLHHSQGRNNRHKTVPLILVIKPTLGGVKHACVQTKHPCHLRQCTIVTQFICHHVTLKEPNTAAFLTPTSPTSTGTKLQNNVGLDRHTIHRIHT